MSRCGCKVGPGKFEGEGPLTYIAHAGLAGGGDMTTGGGEFDASDAWPCVEWFRAPLNFRGEQAAIREAAEYGYCDECIEAALAEADEVKGGMATWEDSQGFVYSAVFPSKAAFDAALAEAEAEDGQSDETQGGVS